MSEAKRNELVRPPGSAPKFTRRQRVFQHMARTLWFQVMDCHLPQTKYVMREIHRLTKRGGTTFDAL